jgi:hypothetical protein
MGHALAAPRTFGDHLLTEFWYLIDVPSNKPMKLTVPPQGIVVSSRGRFVRRARSLSARRWAVDAGESLGSERKESRSSKPARGPSWVGWYGSDFTEGNSDGGRAVVVKWAVSLMVRAAASRTEVVLSWRREAWLPDLDASAE